jgi:N-hydroxyarylamine O-acetyltransferase
MTAHAWQIELLDVDAYLTRLGLSVQPPSRSALDRLLEAHVRGFTFDNIDVLLGQHPGIGLDAVQSKFVGRGRGGYCFEHATLFAAALERLGYDRRAAPRSCR